MSVTMLQKDALVVPRNNLKMTQKWPKNGQNIDQKESKKSRIWMKSLFENIKKTIIAWKKRTSFLNSSWKISLAGIDPNFLIDL